VRAIGAFVLFDTSRHLDQCAIGQRALQRACLLPGGSHPSSISSTWVRMTGIVGQNAMVQIVPNSRARSSSAGEPAADRGPPSVILLAATSRLGTNMSLWPIEGSVRKAQVRYGRAYRQAT
jgi:hypothetical protein